MEKIDLHVHYLTPAYRKALLDAGLDVPDGYPSPQWDAEEHVNMMERQGIGAALLSISSPHVNFGKREKARALARNVHEYGADAVRRRDEKRHKMIDLVDAYHGRGGHHLQINCINKEILREAQVHPEKYPTLMVRVAGYVAYFVELSKMVQDGIIARTSVRL